MKTKAMKTVTVVQTFVPGDNADYCVSCRYPESVHLDGNCPSEEEKKKSDEAVLAKRAATKALLTESCFIAMIPHYWGRGSTLTEARANLRKAACGRRIKVSEFFALLIVGDAQAWVDEMGSVCYKGSAVMYRIDGPKGYALPLGQDKR